MRRPSGEESSSNLQARRDIHSSRFRRSGRLSVGATATDARPTATAPATVPTSRPTKSKALPQALLIICDSNDDCSSLSSRPRAWESVYRLIKGRQTVVCEGGRGLASFRRLASRSIGKGAARSAWPYSGTTAIPPAQFPRRITARSLAEIRAKVAQTGGVAEFGRAGVTRCRALRGGPRQRRRPESFPSSRNILVILPRLNRACHIAVIL
jgi:hypothetical protein